MGFTLKHFLVILVMASICKLTTAGWLLAENTVVIKNDFRSNAKYLYVHCHSADDDLGEHWLKKGQKYSWSFDGYFGFLEVETRNPPSLSSSIPCTPQSLQNAAFAVSSFVALLNLTNPIYSNDWFSQFSWLTF
ncbi:hypothetical protein ACOSQ4_017672 [Xanthoceras sorbifolium]